jgi:hypothetical protein
MIFSPDSKIILIADEAYGNILFIWNIVEGNLSKIINPPSVYNIRIKFSPWEPAFYLMKHRDVINSNVIQKYSYEGRLLAELDFKDRKLKKLKFKYEVPEYADDFSGSQILNSCTDFTFTPTGSIIINSSLKHKSEHLFYVQFEFSSDFKFLKIFGDIAGDFNDISVFSTDGTKFIIENDNSFDIYNIFNNEIETHYLDDDSDDSDDDENGKFYVGNSTRKYLVIENYPNYLIFVSRKDNKRQKINLVDRRYVISENPRYPFLIVKSLKILPQIRTLQSISRQHSLELANDLLPAIISELIIEDTKFQKEDSDLIKVVSFLHKYVNTRSIGKIKDDFIEELYQALYKIK